MNDYLTAKYAATTVMPKSKKKRRKVPQGSVQIIDDEDFPFEHKDEEQEEAPAAPVWKPVGRSRSRSPSMSPSHSPRRSPSPSPPPASPKMSNGTRAGLQSAQSVKQDLEILRQQQLRELQSLDAATSGRDAPTVYRNATGRKIDLAAERAQAREQQQKEEEEEEARMEWGKGIKQTQDAKAMAQRLKLEADAPLAVYVDDHDRNEELKARDRWGDPMAGKSKSKSVKEHRQVYRGPPPPPNRFGIPPVCFFVNSNLRDTDGTVSFAQTGSNRNTLKPKTLELHGPWTRINGAQPYVIEKTHTLGHVVYIHF